jgi:hypothetical protein
LAPADDATAKFVLDAERQWQEANCDHNKITEKILADDFWGTLPDGTGYGKSRGSEGDGGSVEIGARVPHQ